METKHRANNYDGCVMFALLSYIGPVGSFLAPFRGHGLY